MNAGDLDERITIEQLTETLDTYGAPQHSWATLATVWAHRHDLSDGERFGAGQTQSTRTVRFTVRRSAALDAVTPADRIVHESKTYQISHVKPASALGRGRYLEITAGSSDGAPDG